MLAEADSELVALEEPSTEDLIGWQDGTRLAEEVVGMEGTLGAPDCNQHMVPGLGVVVALEVELEVPGYSQHMAPGLEVEGDAVDMEDKLKVPDLEGTLGAQGYSQHMVPGLQEAADLMVLAGLDTDDVLAVVDSVLLASWTWVDFEETIG